MDGFKYITNQDESKFISLYPKIPNNFIHW